MRTDKNILKHTKEVSKPVIVDFRPAGTDKKIPMNKNQELEQLRGIGKMLDNLWENSYYSMGQLAVDRIEKEMIYFFGKNWSTDMYDFIQDKGQPGYVHPTFPRPLSEIKESK